MNRIHKITQSALLMLTLGIAMIGCDKIVHPPLGAYPKDANPVGGPLKFYAAYEKLNADSIRATFASTDSVTSYVAGASGQAVQFNPVLAANGADSIFSFLIYPNANDFASTATSFTFSFWLNIPLSKKDNVNADGVFSLSSSVNFWGNITAYADHSTGGGSDSMDLKFHFMNGSNDNWDFANYVGANRWPHMYDGNWHNVVFTYDAAAKTGTFYRDGVQFDQKTNESIAFDGNASNLVVGGFEQAANIQGDYAGNTWMNGFPGALDQIRFYAEALSASDVAAIYANKQ
jgi:hypothetical protein